MANRLFSVASWNVEHFKGDRNRVERVIAFLDAQRPDVFGLYEVEGKEVFAALVDAMPQYTFQITEGEQTQEILVGVKRSITSFITQKVAFKAGTTHMRPGQLVTLVFGETHYPILFLHLSSGTNPRGMGLRDDMLGRAIEFKKALKAANGGGEPNYIFLGDLNTMGLNYPSGSKVLVDAPRELATLDQRAARRGLRRLAKTAEMSWWNGPESALPPSNLDHVIAADHIRFRSFKKPDGAPAEVSVRGWATEPDEDAQAHWIRDYSDHSLLYFEVLRS